MANAMGATKYPDLFDYTPPPYRGEPPSVRHSETSKAAAQKIKKAIGPLHKRILAHLENGGATDEEMQRDLDMGANTQRPRRRELQLLGKIEDSGQTRLTRAGHSAVVWQISKEKAS
jgi:hypothetical protein